MTLVKLRETGERVTLLWHQELDSYCVSLPILCRVRHSFCAARGAARMALAAARACPPCRGRLRCGAPRRRRFCARACAPPGGVYSEPALYDAAFCQYRTQDIVAEAAFLLRCAAARAGDGRPLAYLDLACGPGRHAHAAATHPGCCAALGVDISAAMVAYASALQPGSRARFAQGDITALLSVKEAARPGGWDVVALLHSSLTHLHADGAAAACLRGMARLLSPRGVACLELEHIGALFDGSLRRGDGSDDWYGPPAWDEFTPDGLSLHVRWGAPGDVWDPVRQTIHRSVNVDVYRQGQPTPRQAVTEVIPTRFFGVPELELLAAAAGLRVTAIYGAMREGVAPGDANANRLVLLLQRDDAPSE